MRGLREAAARVMESNPTDDRSDMEATKERLTRTAAVDILAALLESGQGKISDQNDGEKATRGCMSSSRRVWKRTNSIKPLGWGSLRNAGTGRGGAGGVWEMMPSKSSICLWRRGY